MNRGERMSRILSKIKDFKINVKQDGFSKTFKSFEQEWLPSNKTALTIVWIIVSLMAGELIIYKHQNIFSSYAINASGLDGGDGYLSSSGSREKYDTTVSSKSRLYGNILSRYANDEGNKSAVSRELNKIAGDAPGAKIDKPAAAVRNSSRALVAPAVSMEPPKAFSGANNGRVIVHRVKQGETLAQISKKYYRTASRYKEIALQNNLKSPYSVRRGDKLVIVLR